MRKLIAQKFVEYVRYVASLNARSLEKEYLDGLSSMEKDNSIHQMMNHLCDDHPVVTQMYGNAEIYDALCGVIGECLDLYVEYVQDNTGHSLEQEDFALFMIEKRILKVIHRFEDRVYGVVHPLSSDTDVSYIDVLVGTLSDVQSKYPECELHDVTDRTKEVPIRLTNVVPKAVFDEAVKHNHWEDIVAVLVLWLNEQGYTDINNRVTERDSFGPVCAYIAAQKDGKHYRYVH